MICLVRRVFVATILAGVLMKAPASFAQQPTTPIPSSSRERVDRLLSSAAKLETAAQAHTKRGAQYRKRVAAYTRAATRYAQAQTKNPAAEAQRIKIQHDQEKLAAAGERMARDADAVAARALRIAATHRQLAAVIASPRQ
jgi:hypothetical protein